MIVRSKKYPNITVVLKDRSFRFVNSVCDIPEDYTTKLGPDYEVERKEIPTQIKRLETAPDNWLKLSIAMLTFNALKYTQKAIASIRKNTKCKYELIVIDNNSTDGTIKWLKDQELDGLILNKKNLGVAGGRNQGIELAKYDFVCFLDNDTEVGPDWTRLLSEHFKDSRVGIVSKNGVKVLTLKPVQFAEAELINGRLEADVGVGFCLAVRRSLFGMLGSFYTKFPYPKFWHEDLEFGIRVRKSGYKIIVADIPITHYEHKSIGEDVDNKKSVELIPGFVENANHIAELYRDKNVLTVYRDWGGFDASSSYDRYTKGLLPDIGKKMVIIRKPSILTNCLSFDLCKGFEMLYNENRIVTLHQENDRCPKSWERSLKDIDFIFPASEHVREVCKDEPYASKMLPCGIGGIEGEIYNTKVKPKAFFGIGYKTFKFLMVSANQPRKNTINLIRWYAETFKKKDDVVLIIKDGDYGQRRTTIDFIKLVKKDKKCPRIVYEFRSMSSCDLASLYRFVAINGAYIHPHRAEALGLPILEAVACGCRVGTTDWGGPKYTTEGLKTVTHFSYKLVPSSFHNHIGEPFYEKNENPLWAEPGEISVKSFMKRIWKEKYNQTEAEVSSREILLKYDYKNVAIKVIKVLQDVHRKQS